MARKPKQLRIGDQLNFKLSNESDEVLCQWFNNQSNRSEALRLLVMQHIQTHGGIVDAVKEARDAYANYNRGTELNYSANFSAPVIQNRPKLNEEVYNVTNQNRISPEKEEGVEKGGNLTTPTIPVQESNTEADIDNQHLQDTNNNKTVESEEPQGEATKASKSNREDENQQKLEEDSNVTEEDSLDDIEGLTGLGEGSTF